MIQTNDGRESLNLDDDVNSSLGNIEGDLQNDGTINVQGTSFTKEEIEQANKPQPNVILSTIDADTGATSAYRDPERVNSRSNETPDSTDSNSGGIIAGGAKGVSQS